jgi:hypothetical protein
MNLQLMSMSYNIVFVFRILLANVSIVKRQEKTNFVEFLFLHIAMDLSKTTG